MQATRRRRKRRYAAPVGGFFLLMAGIGVVTVVYLCLNLTWQAMDNTKDKEMFGEIISPVLMFDPVPFETPADISEQRLLLYSMWSALSTKGSDYERGDNSELLVPATDLDVAAATLFGDVVELEHQTFRDYDNTYYYDEEVHMYNVPQLADLYTYRPSVEEIELVGDYYRLYVGYIPPTAWTTNFSGGLNEPEPDKYMYYYMVKSGDSYQLAKVEDPPSENAQRLGQGETQDEIQEVPEEEPETADREES